MIDGGWARVPAFDPRRGLDRLELKRISKASATQCAGRAGRTGPGTCLRLWSAKQQAELDEFELPEIMRVDLAGAVLDLHAWGKADAAAFGWFERPPVAALESAQRLLEMLGALDGGSVTPLGKRLISLPLHPRIGRLLCAAAEAGCTEEGATLAALLCERDIRRPDFSQPMHSRGPATQGDSDLLIRMQDLAEAQRHRFAAHLGDRGIDPIAARQVAQVRDELRRISRRLDDMHPKRPSDETLLKLLLWAYPDRVCRRRAGDRAAAAMTGGGGVRLDAESVVRQSELFLALDARDDPRSATRKCWCASLARFVKSGFWKCFHNRFRASARRCSMSGASESWGAAWFGIATWFFPRKAMRRSRARVKRWRRRCGRGRRSFSGTIRGRRISWRGLGCCENGCRSIRGRLLMKMIWAMCWRNCAPERRASRKSSVCRWPMRWRRGWDSRWIACCGSRRRRRSKCRAGAGFGWNMGRISRRC